MKPLLGRACDSGEGFLAEPCSKTAAKKKLPAPFDLTTRTNALKAFSSVTLASGTAAPDWFCTTPLRLALPTCAVARQEQEHRQNVRREERWAWPNALLEILQVSLHGESRYSDVCSRLVTADCGAEIFNQQLLEVLAADKVFALSLAVLNM
jgi:hypothetical protein